ncbi:Clavaminate synthase-like protein [Crucibulum laeve]|uniref:Clavaminate synthase-like protein n=1 Tax=Crucibulum laeve TaxID=68775 RepID=A0A5C3LTF3_9AGAR|nr:Clavaminate synthase-like protein [Crucibulum laeve]
MPAVVYPPFPEGVPVHDSLSTIDYARIKAGDESEIQALWEAATQWGFWYMTNHGADHFFEPMFEMGRETMLLPLEEKMKYRQGDTGDSFVYKAAGSAYTDAKGSKDSAEFLNVSKDDVLSYPRVTHFIYPQTVNARMETTIKPFVEACVEVNKVILNVFNKKLGLPEGCLNKLHPDNEESICEARCVKVSASPGSSQSVALGAHTDFGSLSFLVNKLGGLQVLRPGETEWKYVKPLPGHVICNVGDALTFLSGGILKSCIHRVMPPPLEQAQYDRWSLVYFHRPANSIRLKPLAEDSPLIAEALAAAEDQSQFDAMVTMKEWYAIKYNRGRTSGENDMSKVGKGGMIA